MFYAIIAGSWLVLSVTQPEQSPAPETPTLNVASQTPPASPDKLKPKTTPTRMPVAQREIDPSIFANCKPDPRFLKRFSSYKFRKVRKKVDSGHLRSGKIRDPHRSLFTKVKIGKSAAIEGAWASTKNLYSAGFLSGSRYLDAPYAYVEREFSKEPKYYVGLHDFVVGATRRLAKLDAALLIIPTNDGQKIFERSVYRPPNVDCKRSPIYGGYKNRSVIGYLNQCMSSTSARFEIDKDTFDQIASADPATPFPIYVRKANGTPVDCPAYVSPMGFRAVQERIQDQYQKSQKKLVDQRKDAERAERAAEARRMRNERKRRPR